MAKYQKQIPSKSARNMDTLAAKFDDQGNPTELKWFTRKGYDLIPDNLVFNKQGQKKRLVKDGWVIVDPNDFEPAPAPLTAEAVKGSAATAVDPKAVVTTVGTDAKGKADGDQDQSGDADKGGDQDKKDAKTAESAKTDPKAGGKKS